MGDAAEDREMRDWFQTIKDHAADDQTKPNFRKWCYYEGIFSITTVYYTCSYIQCARELRFQLPFSELDPGYSERLDSRDEFRVAPFLRLLDVYIDELDAAKVDRIRAELGGLVGFLRSERTPEHPTDRGAA
jgi:hypothetical protein